MKGGVWLENTLNTKGSSLSSSETRLPEYSGSPFERQKALCVCDARFVDAGYDLSVNLI